MTGGVKTTSPEQAYSVITNAGKFELRDLSGRCVMACSDQHSADHYRVLLNQAYNNGYRQGRRDQKSR